MFAYPIIIAAMIASGLFIGWINFSYLWGMIPAVIGGFCGSYYSKFGRMLLKPGIDDAWAACSTGRLPWVSPA